MAAAGLWTEPFGGAPCVVSLTERQTCIIGRQAAHKTKGSSTKVAVCHEYHDADMKRGGKSVTTPDGRPVLMWGTVSSNHLTVRMLPDGMVELIDHSTHGTFIGAGEHERRLTKEISDKLQKACTEQRCGPGGGLGLGDYFMSSNSIFYTTTPIVCDSFGLRVWCKLPS